ncbi:MarR family winged helix-turn-helix transcriptional regulator [Herbiconiux sp. CPCC 205716]|uniref:MarR family winged helix-turn-helix transcriptional regulator n=1 Tax=Herbiconiux gentiana TaxID=2970912 RepID=A0ABT2GBY0_9MICO|nr:MarR family winged helix-turn-helix transcriptional regulator [Herbiconiux gentiana]MCS5713162.1 MarR family winged helix-turn-helix transcriptional regulator [Herbiconiux gentiana]
MSEPEDLAIVGRGLSDGARELAVTIIALQRSIVRSARTMASLPPLPTAQAEVIGKLVAKGPLTFVALASELGLARPTISNLVKVMVAEGLLTRRPSESDGRAVILDATPAAVEMTTTFLRQRDDLVAVALEGLSEPDRRWALAVLPSLRQLTEKLEQVTVSQQSPAAYLTEVEE